MGAIGNIISGVWNGIKSVTISIWDGIKTAIITPINEAKNAVKNALDAIFSFFDNLRLPEIKIPRIKLPHFSLSGEFSLAPPSVPKLEVSWYDKGGIFNRPSIIGVGEKRPEFVGALEDLKGIVRAVIQEEKGAGGGIVQNISIHSPTALTPSEIARQVKNVSRQLALEW